jgi:hypothetical protein
VVHSDIVPKFDNDSQGVLTMYKPTKSFAILACVVSTAMCYGYWQEPIRSDSQTKREQNKVVTPRVSQKKEEKPEDVNQDVLYRPPTVVEFLGIPFGMDIRKYSSPFVIDNSQFLNNKSAEEKPGGQIPEVHRTLPHPLLALVTSGNAGNFSFNGDQHQKIVEARCQRNDFTVKDLRQFVDAIRKQYPEIEEIKDKSKGERLIGLTKSGISVRFVKLRQPVLRESDGELIYSYVLILEYESAMEAEKDRQARIARKIAESDF